MRCPVNDKMMPHEMIIEIFQLSCFSCYNCRYYKQEIIQLTDEIDNIHKNIKDKIDAEVQASDVIDSIEREANRPLGGTAGSLAGRDRSLVRIRMYWTDNLRVLFFFVH